MKRVKYRPQWLVEHTTGIKHGSDWDCMYEGVNWALVRVPGYTGWVSVGCQAYHKTSWYIMRRGVRLLGSIITHHVTNHLDVHLYNLDDWKIQKRREWDIARFEVHEGRMNSKLLFRLKEEVDKLDIYRPPQYK